MKQLSHKPLFFLFSFLAFPFSSSFAFAVTFFCIFSAMLPLNALSATWPTSTLAQSIAEPPIHQPFPIAVQSELDGDLARVAVSARIPVAFTELQTFYRNDDAWCQGFFANVYVKACYKNGKLLRIFYDNNDEYQDLGDAFQFDYQVVEQTLNNQHLYISLRADSGPLGSEDYRLSIEAEAQSDSHTVLRLVYQSRYGFIARSALFVYLKTLGRDKIGFSRDQQAQPVAGVRGILERNAMRYLLALCAYFSNQNAVKPLANTLKNWHDYATVFSQELQEIDWSDYQKLKLREYQDQLKLQQHNGELWLKEDW